MAEYFYTNYQPFTIIDSLCIWKRKDFKIKNEQRLLYSFTELEWDSLKINSSPQGVAKNSKNKNYLFKISANKFKDKVVQMPLIKIVLTNQTLNLKPSFVDGVNNMGYYIFNTSEDGFTYQIKNEGRKIDAVNLYECDFIPDFYSAAIKRFDVKQLPYIWGTYDKLVHQEIVLADLLATPENLQKNNLRNFTILNSIDKSTGNTILFSLKCTNNVPVQMELIYGHLDQKSCKGSFVFTIPPGTGAREFAVRVSAQYNWYSTSIDYIGICSKDFDGITINKLQLLKGD